MLNKLHLKKGDIIILLALLFVAVLFFTLSGSGNATAVITCDGEVLHTVELSKVSSPYTINLQNGIEIGVEKNAVYFINSDCSGKDCVNCGRLTSPGDTAVCIPNKTIIKLTGEKKNAPDTIVY